MMIETGLGGLLSMLGTAPTRHGNQQHVPAPGLAAELSGDFVTVEFGHSNVEQRHVGTKLCRCLERLGTVGGGSDVIAGIVQQDTEARRRIVVVVRHENSMAPYGRCGAAPLERSGA